MRISILLSAFILALAAFAEAEPVYDLEDAFRNPPSEYRPLAWWHWINGNISQEGIEADLEDMKRVGLGGVQMLDVEIYLPPGPVRYGSDAWFDAVQHALGTAHELGLTLGLHNCPGWSTSGGPWITPELSMKELVWTEAETESPVSVTVALDQPETRLDFYRDVAVLALPFSERVTKEEILNLSAEAGPDGRLEAKLPPGKWRVFRFGYTSTGATNHPAQPEGKGLEVDKMDPEAVRFQWENSLGRILRESGDKTGDALNTILIDSFEAGRSSWTESFPALFLDRTGYDIHEFLPALAGQVIESEEVTRAFLADYRLTLSEGIIDGFYRTMTEIAASHDLEVMAETYASPDFDQYRAGEVITHTASEFFIHQFDLGWKHWVKKAASVSHTLGRDLVAAEAFSARPEEGRWRATPRNLKAMGDLAFSHGITQFLLHSYVHQPRSDVWPGFTLGRYGTHFGRLNPWWEMAGSWIDYLSRCQFLLRQGRYSADFLVLLPSDPELLYQEGLKQMPPGFANDTITATVLQTATVDEGVVALPGGMRYRVLLLPGRWTASIDLLRKVREFAEAGVPVYGPPPRAPLGLRELEKYRGEWSGLVAELWGNDGRTGPVGRNSNPARIAKQLNLVEDFRYRAAEGEANIHYLHRIGTSEDFYFLANADEKPVRFSAEFRITGRRPELWDPLTGRIHAAAAFRENDETTSMDLYLESHGSLFVVFRDPVPERSIVSIRSEDGAALAQPQDVSRSAEGLVFREPGKYAVEFSGGATSRIEIAVPETLSLSGPWEVSFRPMQEEAFKTDFQKLSSWSEHADPRIRYFAGRAVYRTAFTVPSLDSALAYRLGLGAVADIAEVRLNGRLVGSLWTEPYAADVTSFLREGENRLEITVVNRAVNRLIGDERFPPDAEYQKGGTLFTVGRLLGFPDWYDDAAKRKERQRKTFSTWTFYTPESSLVPSGLLGPVELAASPIVSMQGLFGTR